MKSPLNAALLAGTIGAIACGGCMAPQKDLAHPSAQASALPQLVRFFSVQTLRLKGGDLVISGKGSAAADGGKTTFTAKSPLSSYPLITMTIRSDKADELESCRQNIQTARDEHRFIDIRGMGTFRIESPIDPPLDTGIFMLTTLDACGPTTASIPAAPAAVSSGTVRAASGATSAADLLAVPEQFVDRSVTITGQLVSPVHFGDPVSSLMIQSEGQFLPGYFVTASLPAESRLSLVHGKPGSTLILEGTLRRINPKSLSAQSGSNATGYEFDISKVISVSSL